VLSDGEDPAALVVTVASALEHLFTIVWIGV
jgi:hypothetical protein